MENEKTKFCDNCLQNIALSKFMLHERMCSINVKKCPICKQPVTVEDTEDHMNDFHVEIPCEFCEKKFTKDKIEKHKKNCDYRMKPCKFCEMNVILKDLKEHEYVCGSKTEQCLTCKQMITKRDWENHKKKGCQPPIENKNINNDYMYFDNEEEFEKMFYEQIKQKAKEVNERTKQKVFTNKSSKNYKNNNK